MASQSNSKISCEGFENRIQDLMDQRIALADDQDLNLHANQCPQCRSVLSNFSSLEKVLFSAFAEQESLSGLPDHRTTHGIAAWSISGAMMAIAAVLALIIIPTLNRPAGNMITVAQNDSAIADHVNLPDLENSPEADIEIKAPVHPSVTLVSYDLPPTLKNAYHYAAELPGIRPIECSLNVTIEVLQNSWKTLPAPKQNEESPDLGHSHFLNQNGMA